MYQHAVSCFRFGVNNICVYCSSDNLIKSGKTTNQKQRFKCKNFSLMPGEVNGILNLLKPTPDRLKEINKQIRLR
jgi:hypothetical protein